MKITLNMNRQLKTSDTPRSKKIMAYLKELSDLMMDGQDLGVIRDIDFYTDPTDCENDDIQLGHSLTLKD